MAKRLDLTILGVKHKVYIDNNQLAKYLEDDDYYTVDDVRGLYADDVRAIYVRSDLDPLDTVRTILHEWFHAVGFITGHVSLASGTQKCDRFVDQLALAVTDLLSQRQFCEFLMDLIEQSRREGDN